MDGFSVANWMLKLSTICSNVSPLTFAFTFMQHPLQNTYVLSPFYFPYLLPFCSFHALDTYIQSQKALLARTQSDLDRLRRIRDQATTDPETVFHSFDEKVFFVFNHQSPLFNQRSHSSMILFSPLIVSPTLLPRSKIKSTGIYSDVKVCPFMLPL